MTTPASLPFSTTTSWRTPRSAIACIASDAVADAGSVTIGEVITSASGASSELSGQHDAAQQVDQREHADRRALAVERDDRAHLGVRHLLRGLAQRRRRGAGDRRVAHELGERARQRLLLGRALAVLAVQALERLLERLGDRLRAEALELGRAPAQLEEVVAREQVAERVLQRGEDLGRRAAGGQRADREQLARAERALRRRTAALSGRLPDEPALDDVQMRDRTAVRREDRRVLRELGEREPRRRGTRARRRSSG